MSYSSIIALIDITRQKLVTVEEGLDETRQVLETFTVNTDYETTRHYEQMYNMYFFKKEEYLNIIDELHEELTRIRYRAERAEKENK